MVVRKTKKELTLVRIGAIVKSLRGTRTQDEVAEKAGIARNILSNIENARNYQVKNLARVLNVLGGDVDSLFDLSAATDREKELHRRLHELLHAEDPWPTVITYNMDSVYLNYVAKRGAFVEPGQQSSPAKSQRLREPRS